MSHVHPLPPCLPLRTISRLQVHHLSCRCVDDLSLGGVPINQWGYQKKYQTWMPFSWFIHVYGKSICKWMIRDDLGWFGGTAILGNLHSLPLFWWPFLDAKIGLPDLLPTDSRSSAAGFLCCCWCAAAVAPLMSRYVQFHVFQRFLSMPGGKNHTFQCTNSEPIWFELIWWIATTMIYRSCS